MKRVGYLMQQITSLDNIYLAYQKAQRGKQRKKEVINFRERFDENINLLYKSLSEGNVSVGEYRYFTIHDPKERTICAAPFCERVIQHAIMNVCHEYFDRTLIDTTYATRKGKGVYAALDKAVTAISRYRYSVKLDVRKYYDSIDHKVLKERLRRMFKDKDLLTLFDKIFDSYCVTEGIGLPIGNLTSQYFANTYLSTLDHKAKELYHAPIYIRYMDDILIAGDDLNILKECVRQILEYGEKQLNIMFKPPIFRKAKDGQTFLGYRVMPYHYKLSGRSKRRFRTKLLKYDRLLETGRWMQNVYQEHILPLLAFTEHAVSKDFRNSCMKTSGVNRRVGLTA